MWRGHCTLKTIGKTLEEKGWKVEVEKSSSMTKPRQHTSGVYKTNYPKQFNWTYFKAEKDGVVFERHNDSVGASWVIEDILRHFKFQPNYETGKWESEG